MQRLFLFKLFFMLPVSDMFLQAAAWGDMIALVTCFEKGVDVEARDSEGHILRLTSHRFCIDAINCPPFGNNALHLSCLMGNEEIITFLCTRTPRLAGQLNQIGETPLLLLCRTMGLVKKVSLVVFEALLWCEDNLDCQDIYGNNIMGWLVKKDVNYLRIFLNYIHASQEDVNDLLPLPKALKPIVLHYCNFLPKERFSSLWHRTLLRLSFKEKEKLIELNSKIK